MRTRLDTASPYLYGARMTDHKPLKVDVKWINGEWHAFMPSGTLRSAGVMDIIDQVHEAWPELPKGREIEWTATETKFVVRDVESAARKLSKTDPRETQ